MTAKEYLKQVKDKWDEIAEQQEYIEELRTTLEASGIRYDREAVQGSGDTDRMTHVIIKVIEQEEKLERMKQEYILFRFSVIEMIHKLKDIKHRKLLSCVYIDFKTLKESANVIGYSYDYTRELHIEALNEFHTMFPHCSL